MVSLPEKATFRPGELPRHLPISRATVYRLIEEGKIYPVERFNKKIIIPRDSLVVFLRAASSP